MTHVAEHAIARPVQPALSVPQRRGPAPWRPQCRDPRWPNVAAALSELRADKRRSVRIVDADCGTGELLLCAVRFARTLGFTAIEARGITAPAQLDRTRAAAAAVRDPAIGLTFEACDLVNALDDETDFPADIVLWHGCAAGCDAHARQAIEGAVARAGRALVADAPRAAIAGR